MPNKFQKQASALQDQRRSRRERRGPELRPVDDEPRQIPRCPSGLTEGAQATWRAFWLSPAGAITSMDIFGPALKHWIRYVSEREHVEEKIAKEPIVKGSMDQDAPNPLMSYLKELNRKIERYEERFGMDPLAQMRLNIANTPPTGGASKPRRVADAEGQATDVLDLDAL